MDCTKEKIVEMTGTDIAEHGNWIKDLDSKNDFMGADTFWLSESASRIGKSILVISTEPIPSLKNS